MKRQSLREGYEKLVVRKSDKDCWGWKGYTTRGYGRVHTNGNSLAAHRVSYELFVGPIPEGLLVCHKCDNPSCTNPQHLFLGTSIDNIKDRGSKNRHAHGSNIPWTHLTEDDVLRIRQLFAEGKSRFEIAQIFNVDADNVYRIAHGDRWKHVPGAVPKGHRPELKRGEKNGSAKLNDASVQEIRKLWRTGNYSQEALSKMFGVGSTTISYIIHFKTWVHVREEGE